MANIGARVRKTTTMWQTISKYFSNTENFNRNAVGLVFCTNLMSSVPTSYRRRQQGLDLPMVPGFLTYTMMMIATVYRGNGKKLSVLASLGKGNLNEKIPH